MNKRLAPSLETAEHFAIDLAGELKMQQFTAKGSTFEKKTANVIVRVVADDAEAVEYSVIVLTRETRIVLWSCRFAHAPLSVVLTAVDFAIAM